jgi:hypothetical protein
MRKRLQQGTRAKNKLRTRLLAVCVVASAFITIAVSVLVFMNINNIHKTRASATGTEGGGNNLNNGEILLEFIWEKNPVTLATLGPDAIRSGKDAHVMSGGRSSSGGISPGPNGNNIDLEIKGIELFKQDGIDISIDFRRNEESGDFFSRGNVFNFGMQNGFLTITYCIENKKGRIETISEKTAYEIPEDPIFRNYRFIYTAANGKAEIFVNSIIIWQYQVEKNTPMAWNGAGNIVIGRNLNGNGVDRVVLDNLIVRSTGTVAPLAESLLNFMLESKDGGVKVHWSTSINEKVEYFSLERSIDGINFVGIANVPARPDTSEDEYTYTDRTTATTPLVYYRLRQTFKNGKFVTHALSALKLKTEKDFTIERISPIPFQKSCDISYYLPKSGRVWIQITDEKGKIYDTNSFEAPQGKNVHVFSDDKKLQPGNYTFSLMFDNKKLSMKVVKA